MQVWEVWPRAVAGGGGFDELVVCVFQVIGLRRAREVTVVPEVVVVVVAAEFVLSC